MALNIRNEAVHQLAKKLAVRTHLNITDAVKLALENELRRLDDALPLRKRLRPLQDRMLARPATGLEASILRRSEPACLMFVDASAIVAILTREREADSLADRLEAACAPVTSPIAVFEAAVGICRKRDGSVKEAKQDVREFLELARIRLIPISAEDAATALVAFSRYGKRASAPRATQPRRLLRLCDGEESPDLQPAQ
jgi:ribonuclease VapC